MKPAAPDPAPLFSPSSIAVVGATERIGAYADTVIRNLHESGYSGEIWGINPGRQSVHGHPCLPSLLDLPEPVDAVAVAVPARLVPAAAGQAIERGCGGAVVISAGFGEVESGKALEAELKDLALGAGFPVCGPNGNGIISVASRASLWGDSLPALRPGPVAVVSQSGNIAVNAIGSRRGIDFHTIVSTGNQAVLDTGAWLKAIAKLDGVSSIALFQETDGDGSTLAEALAECADNRVRVAVLKVGSSEAGGRAAAAHTGAVAGDQKVFRALMEEAGAAWAEDPHELLELARVLSFDRPGRRPPGPAPTANATAGPDSSDTGEPGTAVLTCSGGDSGISADLAGQAGLDLPEFSIETRRRLVELLPDAATPVNPLDYTSMLWTETERLAAIVTAVGEDPAIDRLLLFHDHPEGLRPEHEAEWANVRRALADGAIRSGTPAVMASTLPDLIDRQARDELSEMGIPVVGGIPAAISAARAIGLGQADGDRLRDIAAAARKADPDREVDGRSNGSTWLGEAATKDLLRRSGVAVAEGRIATGPEDCMRAARQLGWPVVLKLSGEDIQHKSEIGAVKVGLSDEEGLTGACLDLLALPQAEEAELLVERMEPPGVEILISLRTDAVVPVLVIGLGGIWAELLEDVVLIPLPAGRDRIKGELLKLRGAALLTGGRGAEPMDLDALAGLAEAAATCATGNGLELLELNPIVCRPDGAVALDAVALRALS